MPSYHVTAGGVVLRALGVFLWRNADPRSLPVAPPADRKLASPAPLPRALVIAPCVLSLVFVFAGAASWFHFRELGATFLRNPAGAPLEAAALRFDRAATGVWPYLSPAGCAKARRIAGAIRQGKTDLEAAARAYEAASAQARRLGPVISLETSSGILAPIHAAIDPIRQPWFTETMTFREIREPVVRLEREEKERRIQGRLTAITPGHAVQFRVAAPGGVSPEPATGVLQPGASFDLPLVNDGTLVVTDLLIRERGLFEVKEDFQIPLRAWTADPIRFPRDGTTAQVRFAGRSLAGQGLPPLSPGARRELGWPESPDR